MGQILRNFSVPVRIFNHEIPLLQGVDPIRKEVDKLIDRMNLESEIPLSLNVHN